MNALPETLQLPTAEQVDPGEAGAFEPLRRGHIDGVHRHDAHRFLQCFLVEFQ